MELQESSSVVLRMEQSGEQTVGNITKIIGLVRARNLVDLIQSIDLEANPRSAKVGQVTEAIGDSIEVSPELFAFKSKGILVGASQYERLDRGRIRVTFENLQLEGILDGGHNTLEIGIHILRQAGVAEARVKKIKDWGDFRDMWGESAEELGSLRKVLRSGEGPAFEALDFLVPVELLLPSDPESPVAVDEFNNSLLSVCSARNNNVQLKAEAKANQSGYFDYLKSVLPAYISKQVEWKTNEGGTIKAADIVALAWIPLGALTPLPKDDEGRMIEPPVPQNIYRSKGDCVIRFERLMSSDDVSLASDGKGVLLNDKVKSALDVAKDLPELFDKIYSALPRLYNSDGGKFGRIRAVKKMNPENSRSQKLAKFTRKPVEVNVPEGFVVPIVYGLKALLRVNDLGDVYWVTDPHAFLDRHLGEIIPKVAMFVATLDYDPQRFGKAPEIYQLSYDVFQNVLTTNGG